jgi:hypothetical protein
VLIDTTPEPPTIPKVSVRESAAQGGRGVFLNAGENISVGEIVTKYSGTPRWATNDEVEALENPKYVYTWDTYCHGDDRLWHVLWDGVDFLDRWDAHCIGHFYNTIHPSFSPPWRDATCAFGLFFGPSFTLDVNVPPDVQLYAVAIKRVRARDVAVELTLDYHHVLTEQLGRPCGDKNCVQCYDSMKRYMATWTHHMRNIERKQRK